MGHVGRSGLYYDGGGGLGLGTPRVRICALRVWSAPRGWSCACIQTLGAPLQTLGAQLQIPEYSSSLEKDIEIAGLSLSLLAALRQISCLGIHF